MKCSQTIECWTVKKGDNITVWFTLPSKPMSETLSCARELGNQGRTFNS